MILLFVIEKCLGFFVLDMKERFLIKAHEGVGIHLYPFLTLPLVNGK
jgi:hypothetical protein